MSSDDARRLKGEAGDRKVVKVTRYGSAGPRPEGMVMTVEFELDGQDLVALNGGPDFAFNEAISFQVDCEGQDEVDRYWSKLSDGGEEGPCGWLKDRFGQMRKIDIDELERAAA